MLPDKPPQEKQGFPCSPSNAGSSLAPASAAAVEQDHVDTTDIESDVDHDPTLLPELAAESDAGSFIAISISHLQDQMKSPVTPAATKIQALERSKSYFGTEDEDQLSNPDEALQELSSDEQMTQKEQSQVNATTQDVSSPQPPSPHRAPIADEKQNKRTSLVGSILNNMYGSRQRSSSGSSMFENFKKHLPDFPALAVPRFMDSHETRPRSRTMADGADSPRNIVYSQAMNSNRISDSPAEQVLQPTRSREEPILPSFDNNQGREISTVHPKPHVLRRATSDNSLYLRKQPTGASEFDDYNSWANVTEMVNSRFKAITDSLQDSSFKIPKMPSINFGSGRPSASRTDSEETRNNTNANSQPASGLQDMHGQKEKVNVTHAREKQHPILTDALSRLHGDLVLLGGYRGSVLREAQPPNRQLWVPVKVGLNLRRADLEVGLTREDELKMEEKIIPDGILSHIGPIDISRRLVRKCKKCRNVQEEKLQFHNYGYDWRLSPDLLCERFIRFLEQLPCNSPERPAKERGAWIIAHSLGGLITRHVVNQRPELFAGVVYAGSPQNCVNILGPLRNGDDVLFSSRVLTAQVNFTLRTSYALLPLNGRCFINRQTGERYDVDFFDVKTWEEYRLSPCIKSPLHRKQPDKRQSIVDTITESISQRSSWFSGSTSSANGPEFQPSSTTQQAKDKATDARDTLESVAEDLEPRADNPMSPDMSLASQSASHKPSVATQSTIPLPAATEYLSRTLTSVRKFKEGLAHIPLLQTRNAYPPASVLFAKSTPTVYGAFVKSREAIKYDDAFDDLAFAAGDGVVLASAAQLPVGYRCVKGGRIETDRGHVGLLGDLEAVGKCLNAIADARERGVGMGAYESEAASHRKLD